MSPRKCAPDSASWARLAVEMIAAELEKRGERDAATKVRALAVPADERRTA